jgi:alpha-ketoglutarate-dependent taurine dioxygenase
MTLQTIDLTPRIGTEIQGDRKAILSGVYASHIRELLEQRGVLVFRGLNITDEEQLAFAATLGQIHQIREKGIYKITLEEGAHDTTDLLRGTFCWHFDGSVDDVPSRATMLHPVKLSEVGGQTEFANTYASYADLPDAQKKAIANLKIVHQQESLQRTIFPNPTEAQVARWRAQGTKVHPLVWNHRSGRKSLVLGMTASKIVGMDEAEGRALIEELQEWAVRPQYVYQHHWKLGDLLMWDNTGVMHRVIPYPLDSGRMLHRTTLKGEEALV